MRVASPGLIACLIFALLPLAGSHAQAPITPPGPPLVVTPPVPQPTPVTPAVVPTPDDLSPAFTIVASIGGEVIGDEVVTLPVGRLLTLTVQGVPGESAAAITWAMNDKSADLSIRESGHYLTFTAPVPGNWLFTAAVNNPDALLGPMVAQRWVKVGHGPQPPPVVVPVEPDEPGPTPVTPADPSDHLNILTSKLAASPDGAAKMRDFYTRLASEVRNDTAGGLKTLGELQAWKTREEKAAFAGHPVTKIVGVSAALNGFLDAELGTLDVFLDHDKAAAAFDRIAAACGRAVK